MKSSLKVNGMNPSESAYYGFQSFRKMFLSFLDFLNRNKL